MASSSWLHLGRTSLADCPHKPPIDRYFSSKGHEEQHGALRRPDRSWGSCPSRRIDTPCTGLNSLPGSPDIEATPEGMTANTGSLGMGISKAKGFVNGEPAPGSGKGEVYVLTGDGELQEGPVLGVAGVGGEQRPSRVTVIVDHNKSPVRHVRGAGQQPGRSGGEGEGVRLGGGALDGHRSPRSAATSTSLSRARKRPELNRRGTKKGGGVSFMEPARTCRRRTRRSTASTGRAAARSDYERGREGARAGASGAARRRHRARGGGGARTAPPADPPAPGPRLRRGAGRGRRAGARRRARRRPAPRLRARRVPGALPRALRRVRHRRAGHGLAGRGMALAGLLPVVHSFACFLSTRPNEQIYNNATEGTKVIYVGSLAGLVPGGPGHSHQSVRDISALGAMPGMALSSRSASRRCGRRCAGRWRAPRTGVHPARQRALGGRFEPPEVERLEPGRGSVLREGGDFLFVAAGPVSSAMPGRPRTSWSRRDRGRGRLDSLAARDRRGLARGIADDGPIVRSTTTRARRPGDGSLRPSRRALRTLPRVCTRSV